MLKELIAEGLGVIERAELRLEGGCSALTGETGAGKTLVVAAVGLLLGGRADRALVRAGAGEARVDGLFELSPGHPALTALVHHGILEEAPAEATEVVVSRSVSADGKASRARINGRIVTAAVLESVGSTLVEIAGQHEHHRLTSTARHRELLDAFAGADVVELASTVASEVRAAQASSRALEELRGQERAREREIDVLRFETKEIAAAELVPGESDRLRREARRLEGAESIASSIDTAVAAIRSEGGIEELADSAARALRDAAEFDPSLRQLADRVASAAIEMTDVAQELATYPAPADPEALADTRARLEVIARLTRKYGDDEAAVLEYLERSEARLSELDSASEDAARLEAEVAVRTDRARALAEKLSAARAEAAPRLTRQMEELLGELALSDARFEVALRPADLYEGGLQNVEFLVSLNDGEELRPPAKVASGGELSRTALALHLLCSSGNAETLVFDEVDAGVGGMAARSVGRCLAELAERSGSQVLVVTHLPQVAAFADSHYRVAKASEAGRTSAVVTKVEGDERIEELSRMLAGLPESERAREHAQELLDMAAAR